VSSIPFTCSTLAALPLDATEKKRTRIDKEKDRAWIGSDFDGKRLSREDRMMSTTTTERLIGSSGAMQSLRAFIPKVASRNCNVLITGETGTGKERVAEAIHVSSPRASRGFVCINCAALPDALFESELFGHEKGAFTGAHTRSAGRMREAEGGTVFLDEVGDMSLVSQAKILRAIEQKEIYRVGGRTPERLDVRIVAATNQDLEQMVTARAFRSDLFYRLNVVNICLPPLRERPDDVTPLFEHYMRELGAHPDRSAELSAAALSALLDYAWPGNIRELRNLVELLLIDPDRKVILPEHLPPQMRTAHGRAKGGERERLLAALSVTHWNKSAAARELKCSRMTLYRKMIKYDLRSSAPQQRAQP
jgi:DNA-binding NtrC family response regulator